MNYSYCCRASSNWYIRFNTPQWHWIVHSKRKICIVKINHSQDLLKKPTCVSNVLQDKYRNLQMSWKQSSGVKTVILLEKIMKNFWGFNYLAHFMNPIRPQNIVLNTKICHLNVGKENIANELKMWNVSVYLICSRLLHLPNVWNPSDAVAKSKNSNNQKTYLSLENISSASFCSIMYLCKSDPILYGFIQNKLA